MRRSSLALGLALVASLAGAQQAQERLVKYRRTYQDDPAVYLQRSTTYRIERTTEGARAICEVEEDKLLLKGPASEASEREVHYSALTPLIDLEAYTLNGRKRVPTSEVRHTDVLGGTVFHDDRAQALFLYRGLAPGSIEHLRYSVLIPDARMSSGHFFSTWIPSEESTLTVISDDGVEVDLVLFNCEEEPPTIERSREKGRTVIRASLKRSHALRFEDNAPGPRHYVPHAQLVVRVTGDGGAGLTDLDRLYRWSYPHIRHTFDAAPAELKDLAGTITAGLASDSAKAAAIHDWVQDNIHYVAFEDGMNGLVPANADQVCRSRYGDCKGMSNLLVTLLRAEGLSASLAWIGTRELPYTFGELPTGSTSDHMICALDLEGSPTLFLDPTAKNTPFGAPARSIQGKEALIAIDSVRYRVERVPEMPAAFSSSLDSCRVRIMGNDLVGEGTFTCTGYLASMLRDQLNGVEQKERKALLRALLMRGSDRFQLDTFAITGLNEKAPPLRIEHRFRIPGHVRDLKGEQLISPVLVAPWKELDVKPGRQVPYEVPCRNVREQVVELALDPTATTSALPSPFIVQRPDRSCTVALQRTSGGLRWSARSTVDTLLFPDTPDELVTDRQAAARASEQLVIIRPARP